TTRACTCPALRAAVWRCRDRPDRGFDFPRGTRSTLRDYNPTQLGKTFLCSALLLLAAQQAPPPNPAFKSSITVVEVDVVVTDKSGRPVRGLRGEDFEISEDGSRVEIATFSAVDVPEAPRDSVIPPPDRSGSAFASNDHPDDGRMILIVLDDIQVSFTAGRIATVKSIARRAVERLGPADLAGVMTTSGRLGGQAEFTTD